MTQSSVEAARHVFGHLAGKVDVPFSIRLWDGTVIPLGRDAADGPTIAIRGPGVLGGLFRRPSLDHLFRRYVSGDIEIQGGDLIGFVEAARERKKATRIGFSDLRRGFPWTKALPLLLARDRRAEIRHEFRGGDAPRRGAQDRDKDFIQFHYDASNAVLRALSQFRDDLFLRLFPRLVQPARAGAARQARHHLPQAAIAARGVVPRYRQRLGSAVVPRRSALRRHRAWRDPVSRRNTTMRSPRSSDSACATG